jgi:hypothetical protein
MMAQTFFQILPAEIRNKIYQAVFSSPTGSIYLLRTSVHDRIAGHRIATVRETILKRYVCLPVLRTCRQIYEECKHILWTCNTLDVGEYKRYDIQNSTKA